MYAYTYVTNTYCSNTKYICPCIWPCLLIMYVMVKRMEITFNIINFIYLSNMYSTIAIYSMNPTKSTIPHFLF